MASVITILSDVGHAFEKLFKAGTKVATVIEPEVDILFPGISTLFNGAVTLATSTEAAASTANAQSGTGVQKLAFATTQIEPLVMQYMSQNNLVPAQGVDATNVVTQAVVNILNAFSPVPSKAVVISGSPALSSVASTNTPPAVVGSVTTTS
jgi:hypothetical protein